MKQRKLRVAILFGGKSAEHEVSINSARNVVKVIDKTKYNVRLIGIDKKGFWHIGNTPQLLQDNSLQMLSNKRDASTMRIFPMQPLVDVVFPVLHGPYGEDGSMQGFLKLINIPFVGASVLGSALGMDKDVMKRLLKQAKIPIVMFMVLYATPSKKDCEKIVKKLGLPLFVKPANLGSSIGVTKVTHIKGLASAIQLALQYDTKILLESYVEGREIECSVLGNENPIASIPGEIIVKSEFYSYEAKYLDPDASSLQIPADISATTAKRLQSLAIKTYKALCCEGMARVDFFLAKNGKVYINEINTIPGFTNSSMYPKLWEASGIPQTELIDRLIQLAIESHATKQRLKTSI